MRLNGAVTLEDKQKLRAKLADLETELNDFLSAEYGIKKNGMAAWKGSHKPFHWFSEFHYTMDKGGFDVIIGNPPYVEISKVASEYRTVNFASQPCGNLYALCIERCLGILAEGGTLGLVVQQPVTSTQRMKLIRAMLVQNCRLVLSSTYDDRPSKLFDGIHHARIAILLGQRAAPKDAPATVFVTRYMKWYKEERDTLFNRVAYLPDDGIGSRLDVFPKIGTKIEMSLARKILGQQSFLGALLLSSHTKFNLFYKITGVGHWFTITRRAPKFIRAGIKSSSSREESMCFANTSDRDRAFCVLNSSLFYWFYQLRTNCRDFNPSDFRTFPVPGRLSETDFKDLAGLLETRLDQSATLSAISHSKTGKVQVERFKPRSSKDIIDEIDKVLAKHYNFADEELDFIINYDIKYRLGLGADAAGEEN